MRLPGDDRPVRGRRGFVVERMYATATVKKEPTVNVICF